MSFEEFSCEMFSDDAQLRCFCVRRMRITIYTGLFLVASMTKGPR